MVRLIEYLKFRFTSTNQHGVHSPFVYGFITKCLYSKSKFQGTKTEKVILKCVANLDIETIWISDGKKAIKKKISHTFPKLFFDVKPYDMVCIDITEFDISFPFFSDQIKNDTVVIIDSIHKNNINLAIWETIKNKESLKVTLDLYYCGIVFLRRQQAKEHFKIRI
ncbi:MAG: hypothetical protein MUO53_18010 [Maribacter sp.]|nr:hypothetical protein [Maribacter sp.]